jgi:hypothetical protein
MRMLQVASVLLLLTAGGGIVMALQRLGGEKNPSSSVAMAHGFLAASAFTLLIYDLFVFGLGTAATFGLILLAVGAAGGVIMNLAYHLADKLIPKWLLHVHIALGFVGTLLILWQAWGR